MTQRRGRLEGTFPDGETDDGTVAEGTFFEDASGFVSVRIGNWEPIPAHRRKRNKRPRDDDTAEIAVRHKLSKLWR